MSIHEEEEKRQKKKKGKLKVEQERKSGNRRKCLFLFQNPAVHSTTATTSMPKICFPQRFIDFSLIFSREGKFAEAFEHL